MTTFPSLLLALASLGPCSSAPAGQERAPAPAAEFDHAHALWTRVLAAHVAGDRFDYAALAKDRSTLDAYLGQLHAVGPGELARWTREQRFAFWINAYNAHVVDLVLTEYPLESIKDIGGLLGSVWKRPFIPMPALHPSGKPGLLSLDDVEHRILRPRFEDARVHAAVNCASESCPPLRGEAFVAARLDEQLDDQVRKWLADPTRNRFDEHGSRATVSAIFDWFAGDFVRDGGSVVEWITRYAPPQHAAWLAKGEVRIGTLDYSWKLNDVSH